MLTRKLMGAPAVLIAIGLVAAACGGGAESSTSKSTAAPTPVAAATVMVAANPKLVNIPTAAIARRFMAHLLTEH